MLPRLASALLILFLVAPWGLCQPPAPAGKLPPPSDLPPPRPVEPAPAAVPPAELPALPAGPGCAVPFVEKTIPYGQVLLVPHERATTLPKWGLREVEVGRGCSGPQLSFTTQKQIVTEMKLVPHEVDQVVTCIETRPETVIDPCTGHCHTIYKSCPVDKIVKVKVYDVVPTQREVIVSLPILKPGPDVIIKKLVLDTTTVPAVERTYSVVSTPNEITVAVPVCPIPIPHPMDHDIPH